MFTLSSVQGWNIARKYGTIAGVSATIRPHTFRHSFAIHLIKSEVDIRRVQLLLDHANLNTTQGYLQFKDEDLVKCITKSNFNKFTLLISLHKPTIKTHPEHI